MTVSVRSSCDRFFEDDRSTLGHCLIRCSSFATFSLMWPVIIVLFEPLIKILLQFLDGRIYLFPEGYPVELVEYRLVEPFTYSISLGAFHFRLRVIDIADCEVQLVAMALGITTELGSPICQNTQQRNFFCFMERKNPVVKQVCRCQLCLLVV